MTVIEKVKKFVFNECKKPISKYGVEPYEFHFVPMVKYAKKLAKEHKVDQETIEIAAWLHDIGSIIYGRENHHITSSKIAEELLTKFEHSKDKIKVIKKSILNHRRSIKNKRISIEEKIIADADALCNFDMIPGLFKAAFIYEGLTQGQAKKSVREKLKDKYKMLHFKNSRAIIRPKYKAAMLLFK